MPWARLDDSILDNRKIAAVGPIGFALHTAAIVYCARNLTDGLVPYGHARHLLTTQWTTDPDPDDEQTRRKVYTVAFVCGMSGEDGLPVIESIINLLVRVGLWEVVPEGYIVHDYLDYNPSRDEVLSLRATKKAAGQAGGQASAQARAKAPAQAKSKQNPTPIPVPLPVPMSLKDLEDRAKKRGVDSTTIPERLAGLRDQLEKKGVRYWLPYVLKQPEAGKSCLFDREVSRWLAEDHELRKQTERDAPVPDFVAGLVRR